MKHQDTQYQKQSNTLSLSAFIRVHPRLMLFGFFVLAAATGLAQWARSKPTAGAPTYRDVAPILQARCVVCHNKSTVSAPAVSGGLALDSYAALKAGVVGKNGAQPIFIAGKSGQSEIIRRLTATSPTLLMPKGGPPLPPEQIALFRKWIDAGAPAGDLAAVARPKEIGPDALPMPAEPDAQDITLPTHIAPTPDLRRKDTPKDAALDLALKIGPLPPIDALAFSPDGKRLAVGGYRAVILWDTTTGRPAGCIEHLAGPIQSLAFRPDGSLLAVAGGAPGMAGEVKIYDTKTLAPVGPALTGHTDQVFCVAWSPDGKRLATASQDKTARLWEWPSGKLLMTFKDHGEAVTKICFSCDGKSVYTASMDHNLRKFDCATGQVKQTYSGHGEGVTALAVSPKGDKLVSAGSEPELRWWNPDSGDNTSKQGGHNGTVNDIVFSRDGKFLASASADHTVRLWDGGNGSQQRSLEGAQDWLYAVTISPDGKLVAAGGADGLTRIWDAQSGRLQLILLAWPPAGKATTPEWIAMTPEGYFDASSAWAARLKPQLAGKPLTTPRLAAFVSSLRQPDNVVKGWQDTALEPAKLPEPAKHN